MAARAHRRGLGGGGSGHPGALGGGSTCWAGPGLAPREERRLREAGQWAAGGHAAPRVAVGAASALSVLARPRSALRTGLPREMGGGGGPWGPGMKDPEVAAES